MTYHGTNTYLLKEPNGITVIDPGPDDRSHVDAIMRVTGGAIELILVTHTHGDHVGAAAELRRRTGAPMAAYKVSADPAVQPDIPLSHGERIGSLQALYTPGHAGDHLCFARDDGIVFTGDHVMAWNSSVVSPPPRGDMAAYIESLRQLLEHEGQLYLPGHGPSLAKPKEMVRELIQHRLARETAILQALAIRPLKAEELAQMLYTKTDPVLKRAAERNVAAHLCKLVSEGRVIEECDTWRTI